MSQRTLDHVGIAVPSLDDAITLWEPLIGANSSGREIIESQGAEITFVGTGVGRIELLAPTTPDSTIARFLARRGAGIHHLCYRVPDLAAAVAEFVSQGHQPVDSTPRPGSHGSLVVFLHPRTTGGVLIELVQAAG